MHCHACGGVFRFYILTLSGPKIMHPLSDFLSLEFAILSELPSTRDPQSIRFQAPQVTVGKSCPRYLKKMLSVLVKMMLHNL